MDDLARMLIEHECAKLMILYCDYLDRKNMEGFASIYSEDAVYKPAVEPVPIVGRDNILAWAKRYPSNRLGRHLVTNTSVSVIDENNATGSCYVLVFREPNPQDGVISANVTPRSLCEYRDEFKRTAEGWKMSRRFYKFNFLQGDETRRPAPAF